MHPTRPSTASSWCTTSVGAPTACRGDGFSVSIGCFRGADRGTRSGEQTQVVALDGLPVFISTSSRSRGSAKPSIVATVVRASLYSCCHSVSRSDV
jgi:hypothetical protein